MIKVLVVDDSALIRSLLSEIIRQESDMELVGAAADAFQAKELVISGSPDVITLDVEMPRVDGLTFLDRLMKAKPTPVIMISTLTEEGAEVTLKALELGAVDFIAKPKLDIAQGIEGYRQLIISKIRIAANARPKRSSEPVSKQQSFRFKTSEKILAIGASTGGTEAIKDLLLQMPTDSPGIVVTQHMPPGFTKTFAARLDKVTGLHVVEAQGGERVLPGYVYLAPGDKHLLVNRQGADYRLVLSDADRVSGHKPSVDVMFNSVAQAAGSACVAVILTGMGRDGAAGVTEIARQGGYVLAQDEQSCVIFGMPREAIATGCVNEIRSLEKLAQSICQRFREMGRDYRI